MSAPDCVDVWRIDLSRFAADPADGIALLSDDERSRANRFVRESDRDAFVAAHSSMRRILSRYAHEPPSALRLGSTHRGKSELASHRLVHFNLSHSGAFAALAVSLRRHVGIDIERVRSMSPEVVTDSLTPEELRRVETAANPIEAFYAHWTMKEAYLKATGDGLYVPLATVSVVPDALQQIGRFLVSGFEFCDGVAGAIAIEHDVLEPVPVLRVRDWSWSALREATVA